MHRAVTCLVAVGAAVILLLAGCGGGDDDVVGTVSETKPATGVTSGADPLAGASTNPVSADSAGSETSLMTGVRAARHEGYDRVVVEFRNSVPGYRIGYAERPVRADGSGAEVRIDGRSVVVIRMEPALDADLTQESAPSTYTGPRRISPGTPEVKELVRIGGFEGVLTWAVGLADRVPFRVTTLGDPPRLVVDFVNH